MRLIGVRRDRSSTGRFSGLVSLETLDQFFQFRNSGSKLGVDSLCTRLCSWLPCARYTRNSPTCTGSARIRAIASRLLALTFTTCQRKCSRCPEWRRRMIETGHGRVRWLQCSLLCAGALQLDLTLCFYKPIIDVVIQFAQMVNSVVACFHAIAP
jgi:hypothetical protein